MRHRGFTMIELMIVIVLVGAMASFAFPRIGDAITKQRVKSARTAIVSLHAKARANAIQRGAQTTFRLDKNVVTITSRHPLTGAADTVGVESLVSRYGVEVKSSRVSLVFDPRGLGMESDQTEIAITRGKWGEKILISARGRVLK